MIDFRLWLAERLEVLADWLRWSKLKTPESRPLVVPARRPEDILFPFTPRDPDARD